MECRHCGSLLENCFVDLGSAPPSNAYLTRSQLDQPEIWYPLRVMVCHNCWLVQTEDFAGRDALFDSNYAYFSSFSRSWLDHAEHFVDEVIDRFSLNHTSHVIEIAANDGYLLQFVSERNINCTGIEPTHSTAQAARAKGIQVIEDFFGVRLAKQLAEQSKQADLIVANNVLAHVPEINDFVSGFTALLKSDGVATFEVPHLLNLVKEKQFDTIYHEHFSYLSFTAISGIFEANGLSVFDVEELPTHGGSLRVYSQHSVTGKHTCQSSVKKLLEKESIQGVCTPDFYSNFQDRVEDIKHEFLDFLLEMRLQGKSVAGYGAAAKGNTLINFSGIRPDLLSFIVDRNPAKQEKFMPGSRIPIVSEEYLQLRKPDYVWILPWNLKEEIMNQLAYITTWGGKFVIAIPSLAII